MASSMSMAVVKPATIESELKISDVADALNVCTRTVRRLIAAGELEARRYGYRTVRIPVSSVEAFRESHRIPTVRREWTNPENLSSAGIRSHGVEWADPTGNKASRNADAKRQLGGA